MTAGVRLYHPHAEEVSAPSADTVSKHGHTLGLSRQGLGPLVGVQIGSARLAPGQVLFELADELPAKG